MHSSKIENVISVMGIVVLLVSGTAFFYAILAPRNVKYQADQSLEVDDSGLGSPRSPYYPPISQSPRRIVDQDLIYDSGGSIAISLFGDNRTFPRWILIFFVLTISAVFIRLNWLRG